MPPPRDPASGPTPASRDQTDLEVTGRLARRTVADLVAGSKPAPAAHRREDPTPTPRAGIGSHRA